MFVFNLKVCKSNFKIWIGQNNGPKYKQTNKWMHSQTHTHICLCVFSINWSSVDRTCGQIIYKMYVRWYRHSGSSYLEYIWILVNPFSLVFYQARNIDIWLPVLIVLNYSSFWTFDTLKIQTWSLIFEIWSIEI